MLVSHFFDEMPANAFAGPPMSGRGRKGFGETGTPLEQEKDPLIKREALELVRAYYKIREAGVREGVAKMIKAIAADAPTPGAKRKLKTQTARR
ncbi:hypothetical protein [Reyranella sp.]|uniref:hypothetical protein n=1 Tax=Reyranella sp. TaxID=1929291 RepID=UPI00272F768F|nr:hypothetical protein [Reyranella sp.]MDP2374387.1 hypothetical protein [Reyranella sp.]